MDELGLKELTEAAFIVPCGSRSRSYSASQTNRIPPSKPNRFNEASESHRDVDSSNLSSAFPRIQDCETDDVSSLFRTEGYLKSCHQVENAIQRALETLYSPVLSELQDTILSYHQHNSLSTSKRSSFYSTQETFFLPGEEDNRDSSNDREELSQDFPSGEGSRIGAAVLAGSTPFPQLLFSKLSTSLSTPSKSSNHPKALLVTLPSTSCTTLSTALKTINLRFRSAWTSISSDTSGGMETYREEEEEDSEEDEIDSGKKPSKKKPTTFSSGRVEGIEKGKDLDGRDLKSWWESLPSPRPSLVLHLPSLESFDPFPLSDLILSLHALNNQQSSASPLTLILGMSTSRRALNSTLPWETMGKLEVGNVVLPRSEEVWGRLMEELFLNPKFPLSLQVDSQTLEFMRMKFFEMDGDADAVMKALQLTYLHHFTTRPMSTFTFSPDPSSISQLSSSFTQDYIWSLRKRFLNAITLESKDSAELDPPLEMLKAVNPLLNPNSSRVSKEKEENASMEQTSKTAFASISQILQDQSPIPLLLAISSKEKISLTRSLKRISGTKILHQILNFNSKESAIASGLTSSVSKVPSETRIFTEVSRFRSEDLNIQNAGIKIIKQWLGTVDNVIAKAQSESAQQALDDSEWSFKLLIDLVDFVKNLVETLRKGLRLRSPEDSESDELEFDSEDEEIEEDFQDPETSGRQSRKEKERKRIEDANLFWITYFLEELKRNQDLLKVLVDELRTLNRSDEGSPEARTHEQVELQVKTQERVKEVRKSLAKLVRGTIEDFMMPEHLPFEEMHLTQFSRTLSHTLDSQDRSTLALALDNPQHVLRDIFSSTSSSIELADNSKELMSLLNEAETIGLLPDVVRAFSAYREAGTLINLGDWWEMWKQGVEDSEERWKKRWKPEEDDDDEEVGLELEEADTTIRATSNGKRSRSPNAPTTPSKRARLDDQDPTTPISQSGDPATPSSSRSQRIEARAIKTGPQTSQKRVLDDLQARFAIAVNHLALMGLLKRTGRKAEHTARINWELPPKIAKEGGKARR